MMFVHLMMIFKVQCSFTCGSIIGSEMPLSEHRVVVFGAGTAGIGIADQVRDAMVRRCI